MTDPSDHDRQQRDLTEELQHDAELRAARKHLDEEHPRPEPGDWPLSTEQVEEVWHDRTTTARRSARVGN